MLLVFIVIVVVWTDLSGKEPYRQVAVGGVVTSGSLHSAMVVHCPGVPGCGFESISKYNISHVHHTHDISSRDHDPVQAMLCMVVEPTLCMYVSSSPALCNCKH